MIENSINGASVPAGTSVGQGEVLILSPMAFLKLQFFLHVADTEVGGFGVCRSANLLYVDDVATVRQLSSPVSVSLEPDAVAEHLEEMKKLGLGPDQSARIWIQTRAGASACSSNANERTFTEACGKCDWSVLFILSRTGQTYARLQFRVGPKTRTILPVRVDWAAWSELLGDPRVTTANPQQDWMNQYLKNVRVESPATLSTSKGENAQAEDLKVRASRLLPLLVPIAPETVD